MNRRIKCWMLLLLAVSLTVPIFAQTNGSEIYKSKCQSCHGTEGTPDPGIAKIMDIKPVNDPTVKSMTDARMIAITTNGKGKMPAFKGKLTDTQIREVIAYVRTLQK